MPDSHFKQLNDATRHFAFETDKPEAEVRRVLRIVFRYCTTLHRLDEETCNVEMNDREQHEHDLLEERTEGRVKALLTGLGIPEEHIRFNGDPRGFPVKVKLPKSRAFNTWGGVEDGWGLGWND